MNKIKIVIEIDEDVYKAHKMGDISPWIVNGISDAVRNGTVLPEHGALIYRDESPSEDELTDAYYRGYKEAWDNAKLKYDRPTGHWKWLKENSIVIKRVVLEQIRAEIDGIEINGQIDEHTLFIRSGQEVKKIALKIINKYMKGANGIKDT